MSRDQTGSALLEPPSHRMVGIGLVTVLAFRALERRLWFAGVDTRAGAVAAAIQQRVIRRS